jgi:DNA-binding response OmpR family regulator
MKNKKILIIEDDVDMQESLQDFLQGEGFVVLNAVDGEVGLKKAEQEKPDLILLDIILPLKDGFEVLRELKASENTQKIPVVVLTNLGNLSDIEKALDLGATTYLVKGDYSLKEIVVKVENVLSLPIK